MDPESSAIVSVSADSLLGPLAAYTNQRTLFLDPLSRSKAEKTDQTTCSLLKPGLPSKLLPWEGGCPPTTGTLEPHGLESTPSSTIRELHALGKLLNFSVPQFPHL